jgi:hypothetical protein
VKGLAQKIAARLRTKYMPPNGYGEKKKELQRGDVLTKVKKSRLGVCPGWLKAPFILGFTSPKMSGFSYRYGT